jgi:hypothetical protein
VLKVRLWKAKASKRNTFLITGAKCCYDPTYVPYEHPLVTGEDSSEYYTDGADTVFVKIKSYATFDVDTSKTPWIRFLKKN